MSLSAYCWRALGAPRIFRWTARASGPLALAARALGKEPHSSLDPSSQTVVFRELLQRLRVGEFDGPIPARFDDEERLARIHRENACLLLFGMHGGLIWAALSAARLRGWPPALIAASQVRPLPQVQRLHRSPTVLLQARKLLRQGGAVFAMLETASRAEGLATGRIEAQDKLLAFAHRVGVRPVAFSPELEPGGSILIHTAPGPIPRLPLEPFLQHARSDFQAFFGGRLGLRIEWSKR
ncbi:MAG: hypothetical protein GC160_02630 [Acidobacteria bacterium]|nr:hypothetical protein [Acidobacteriota bacterium]